MRGKNTKQVILEKSLELFAEHGFEGVSVRDIAGAVGIRESSLYKHFKSKRHIFESLLEEMDRRYQEQAASLDIAGDDMAALSQRYAAMGEDELVLAGLSLFRYYAKDPFAVQFRRMLTLEQYRDPVSAGLYRAQYLEAPIAYQAQIFQSFMDSGMMRKGDARVAAYHFYAPLFLLIQQCDGAPEREQEAEKLIQTLIVQFKELYILP